MAVWVRWWVWMPWVMWVVWRREAGGGFGCRGLGGGYVVGHVVEVMGCVGRVAAGCGDQGGGCVVDGGSGWCCGGGLHLSQNEKHTVNSTVIAKWREHIPFENLGFLPNHLHALQLFEKLPLKKFARTKMIPKPICPLATVAAVITGGLITQAK
ncbi:hypothetical protein CFP56_030712 [Quercus suber]|uniref:Secreted protein n=1 Tax=Quercus suber TaxID=58331 RepID=A0AAW0JMG0_QUESU